MVTNNLNKINEPDYSVAPEDKRRISVCVLLTCYNRREKTMQCLRALAANTGLENVDLHGVLVDDGSTDGTADAVKQNYPWVQVVIGDGGLFWCRGMHQAFGIAMQKKFDFYLWLNDDTALQTDALVRLLHCEATIRHGNGVATIIVGSTEDETSGKLTYGGERRASKWRPLSVVKVLPSERVQSCDTMNGNIVLISAEAAGIAKNLDPAFEHAMGDTDYALRAADLGVAILVAPGVYGTCGHNPLNGTYSDRSLPLAIRWRLMLDRKGLPWRSWLILTRRHAGPLWPIYFFWPYAKLVVGGLTGRR